MAAVPATAQLQNAELITISSFVIATLGGRQKTAQEARTKMITVLNAVSMHCLEKKTANQFCHKTVTMTLVSK